MFVIINGKKIYYETYGQGEPIILIHGLGVTHQMWKWHIEELQNDFQVIVYDLPGHGQSENITHDKNIYRNLADDLNKLMDHLGLEKAAIIGLSLGGRIALTMAIQYSERVSKLIISSTFDKIKGWREKLRTWLGPYMIKKMSLAKIAENSTNAFFPDPEHLEAKRLYKEEALRVDKNALIILSKAAWENDFSSNIKNIKVPTLIFVGERERLMIKIAERILHQIPKARLEIIPDSGHLWPMEKPQLFIKKLREFIKA